MDNSMIENDAVPEDDLQPNPELELMRKTGLDGECVNYKKLTNDLLPVVGNVHSSYLFHPKGRDALKKICICISSTPCNVYSKSWKDLAGALGLSYSQIGCIENYKYDDFTELVLKTFCQRPDASLAQLVLAFKTVERYDALTVAVNMFPALSKFVNADHARRIKKLENNFNNENSDIEIKKMLIPDGFYQVEYHLPITLRNMYDSLPESQKDGQVKSNSDENAITAENIIRRVELLQQSYIIHRQPEPKPEKRKYGKKVLLTFATDGEELAHLVTSEFRKQRNSLLPIGVLILKDHAETVLKNPEHFIMHWFAKMDYVIPIITEGYLQAIGDVTPNSFNMMTSLDTQYIQLIHDLMSKYYIDNSCRNAKIRCVIPKKSTVLQHPHMKVDPVLRVYTYDGLEDIEKLAIRLASASNK